MNGTGPRYLVARLPAFRLERCGYDADDMAGLIDEVKNAMRLVAITPGARGEGLQIGMTASAARARVPEVEITPLDHEGELKDRAALVRAFSCLSDRVSFPWEDDLILEISCVSHLFGGEEGIVARAREQAEHLGHRCRIAVADDPLAASAIATWSKSDEVVPTGQSADRIAELPFVALRPSNLLRDNLVALGIELIGEYARLDPASVAGRFGIEGTRLHKVACGLSTIDATMGWGELDGDAPSVMARMGGAETTLQIHFVLPGLLQLLSRKLGAKDQAAVRLQLVLRLENRSTVTLVNRAVTLGVRVGRPTRDTKTLERLIRQRLENLSIPAPVDEFFIRAVETSADIGWQPGLTDRTEATEPLPDLLARLADHLGDTMFSPVLADSWKPESSWERGPYPPPPTQQTLLEDNDEIPASVHSEDPVEVQEAWEARLTCPRPSLLLPTPEPIQVRCEFDRPKTLHLDRGWVRVSRSEGPERLQGHWWDPKERFNRDYWVILADERIAWIFFEDGHWMLHGWFD